MITKVLALHYWDTRPKMAPFWPLNVEVIKHNWAVLKHNVPSDWWVQHWIMLHEVVPVKEVSDLAIRLQMKYSTASDWYPGAPNTYIERYSPPTGNTRHFFNAVGKAAYETATERHDHFADVDYVFSLHQDRLIVNWHDTNLLVLMAEMMDGKHPEMCHYRKPRYDFISHTIPAKPEWYRWGHNAAGDMGLYRASKVSLVHESREQTEHAAEVYLGKVMQVPCLYMKNGSGIYLGDYRMQDLTPGRVEYMLRLSKDRTLFDDMVDTVENQWCASLHPMWKEIE